ncbi:hypothetical protein JCGZ_06138 [Jatropha curcas]|uniref:Phytocyanin domain-containing protein n=1 Tax=Jatropha curcas TaxID=180498 RepID=A0A067KLQ5_JATCU|nr:cucumber peeling cupredoxin [Jatropha curcas]KDP37082.1 hypothetical protein JCGZ_06138 [Jatropha curcas]
MARFIIGLAFGFSIAVLLLQSAAAQTVHVVGDSAGWTISRDGAAFYTTWARNKNFIVGDILTFNFTTNSHDVLRVQKSSFDACSNSNPIGDVITTGPVNITLDTAGDHYYICTFSQHCQFGQKLAITVSSSSVNTPTAQPPSTTTTPNTPATPSPTNTTADCPTSNAPSSGPTSSKNPRTMEPTASPPPPGSSSSKVLAGFSLSMLAVIMGLLF